MEDAQRRKINVMDITSIELYLIFIQMRNSRIIKNCMFCLAKHFYTTFFFVSICINLHIRKIMILLKYLKI